MPVDFEVVDVVGDRSQPINTAVLIALAQQISARELEEQGSHFVVAMSSMALKRALFVSYSERKSRDARERAKRS